VLEFKFDRSPQILIINVVLVADLQICLP